MFLGVDPELEVVGEPANGAEAVQADTIGSLFKDTEACALPGHQSSEGVQLTPKATALLMRAVTMPESLQEPSEHENEVLHWLVQERSKKHIARSLHIAVKTVKTHASNILACRAACRPRPIQFARDRSLPLAARLIGEVERAISPCCLVSTRQIAMSPTILREEIRRAS